MFHTCKIKSNIVCHLKLELQPHTGKSSQKTKETTHPKVLEVRTLDPPQPPKLT